jgi:peptide/nickel transport system permease protein
LWQHGPALPIALSRAVPTLYLTGAAIFMAVPIAVLLGSLAALRPGSGLDRLITVLSLGGISTVDFWLGLMLILFFALHLGWFPTSGYGGLAFLILPALTLAYRSMGRLTQIARSAMLDEYAKPYVQVARAKGMPERRVFLHAFKNASIPILTLAGDEAANMANGTVAVELIFAWPGIGRLFVQAIERRDLFLVEAIVFVIASIAILINLLVDLAYAYLDPKIRYT